MEPLRMPSELSGLPKIVASIVVGDERREHGMFSVYTGRSHRDDKDVLIKFLHRSVHDHLTLSVVPDGVEAKQKFYGECIKLGHDMFKHPNIIRQLGVCEPQPPTTTSPGLVFEHMFCTLEERLSLPTPLERLGEVRIAKDVMAGLEHLHKKKLVHRNVWTKTIMLKSASPTDCTAKLSNLMLVVKESSEDINEDVPVGKQMSKAADYLFTFGLPSQTTMKLLDFREDICIPPELRAKVLSDDDRRCDRPSHDIFSYGVTMLRMCAPSVALDDRMACPLEILQSMEAETNDPLIKLIRECTEGTPSKRPTAATASLRLSAMLSEAETNAAQQADKARRPHEQPQARGAAFASLEKDIAANHGKHFAAGNVLDASKKEKYGSRPPHKQQEKQTGQQQPVHAHTMPLFEKDVVPNRRMEFSRDEPQHFPKRTQKQSQQQQQQQEQHRHRAHDLDVSKWEQGPSSSCRDKDAAGDSLDEMRGDNHRLKRQLEKVREELEFVRRKQRQQDEMKEENHRLKQQLEQVHEELEFVRRKQLQQKTSNEETMSELDSARAASRRKETAARDTLGQMTDEIGALREQLARAHQSAVEEKQRLQREHQSELLGINQVKEDMFQRIKLLKSRTEELEEHCRKQRDQADKAEQTHKDVGSDLMAKYSTEIKHVQSLQGKLQARDNEILRYREANARSVRERRLLYDTLERASRPTGVQFDHPARRSSACCLVLGVPPTGNGLQCAQWSSKLGGRDAQFREVFYHASRRPCVHNGRVFTALWKKDGQLIKVGFRSSPLNDLHTWTSVTKHQTLPEGANKDTHQFDFISHAQQVYCVASSQIQKLICLLRLQEAADPRDSGEWIEVDRKNEFRANYGIGVVGDELIIVGGTAHNGSGVQVAKLDILAFNLAHPGPGGNTSQWPQLGMSCICPDVVFDGKRVCLFNGQRDGVKLQTTVLSIDYQQPIAGREWRKNDSLSEGIMAGCGVTVSNGYIVTAGGIKYRLVTWSRFAVCSTFVQVYSEKLKKWLLLTPMAIEKTGVPLLADDGVLVSLGGYNDPTADRPRGMFVKRIEVLSFPDLPGGGG